MNILIIDAQGGGIGKSLTARIRKDFPEEHITAVGTNSIATSSMLKAGAHEGATGENAVRVACRSADVIIGPVGIILADAMIGEITPCIAQTVAQADAIRILIPFNSCSTFIAGTESQSAGKLLDAAMERLRQLILS